MAHGGTIKLAQSLLKIGYSTMLVILVIKQRVNKNRYINMKLNKHHPPWSSHHLVILGHSGQILVQLFYGCEF